MAKTENLIDPAESLHEYASKVLGSQQVADEWLLRHNVVLGGVPALIATKEGGEQKVRAILLKIEHGLPV